MDVDNDSAIKQERGSASANDMIRRTAEVLRGNFRSADHICRIKEDEFVVIMTRMTSQSKELVFSKIEHVNQMLKEERDGSVPIELSVGIAFSDREQPDGDVFQDADTALQRMKAIRQTGYAVY